MDIKEAFGSAVRARRAERGMSQDDLAGATEMARSFVSGMERGLNSPTLVTVEKIAQALDCKPSDLLLTAERILESPPRKGGKTTTASNFRQRKKKAD